ncbi:fibronectin type III domain-containing protein 11 [Pezoporus wallicus]|uniref:fibronectin type III domain-containing protein 11 n=1 Tax=Pezoporus wallicus TaxID=35540 RepID=UPI00254F3108|nr:fibronectin type III domain-containing protein 11 [Pezoporus wallicus]XP_061297464.1 fibronectin type III domain-containing protein 11 [Pezoporus flaviventris]
MAAVASEPNSSWESTAQREAQGSGTWDLYVRQRSLIRQFLRSSLSLPYLQKQQNKVRALKRCSFYLDIEPKYVNVTDQNHGMHRIEILQLIGGQRLRRVRKMGKTQTQIQLLLLTELLEQLHQGRQELNFYVEFCDMTTFFSQWDRIRQKLCKLTGYMETLLSLEFPGKICVKHSLVSHMDLTGSRPPSFSLSLYTKMPVVFDRKESFALDNWARLKWFTENQESHLEQCELSFKLLTVGLEVGFGRTYQVSSNSCVVHSLKPGRSYEFTIRRSPEQALVLEEWHDTIVLTTRTTKDVQRTPEG